jgi:DNA-binding CsgD family transcriptional regulator
MMLEEHRFESGESVEGRATAPSRAQGDTAPLLNARQALRWAAERTDAEFGIPGDLCDVWRVLVSGSFVIQDYFRNTEFWYVLLRAVSQPNPLQPCDQALLEYVLANASQKRAALEHEVSASTVSSTVQRGLRSLGLTCKPQKVPLIVALLARANTAPGIRSGRFSACSWRARSLHVVSLPRPELQLQRQLTVAQYDVACSIIDGASHAQISRDRRKSVRTVANQIASVFQRLGVSGRGELIRALLEASDEMIVRTPWRSPSLTRARPLRPSAHSSRAEPLSRLDAEQWHALGDHSIATLRSETPIRSS